ncbi:carbohydrate ABC transporter permease [Pararhizobium sp. IMCC21322]|uniref:carbohydrate ABC transporter permease n=1 Tax=Pararhizobium sp. IMCC21322 TaxID=3067903 RepID=UPI002740F2B0|nr:sugar ABC transporter permease [Pararhizobium sp. IMCC21322]
MVKRRLLTRRWVALMLFLPLTLGLFTLMVVMPMFEAANFSFYKWNGFGPPTDFVGLRNYDDVLTHRHFFTAVKNSFFVIAVSLLVQLPLALWAALALVANNWGISMIRTLFFLPYMLAEIAAGLMWRFVYDGDYGLVPAIGNTLGIDTPFVLGDKLWVMPAIMLVIVWKYFGFHMMIYIAALQSIPREVIEAARLDGVSPWKITRYIKIPMIRSAILISVFFAIIGALQLFDLIIPLSGGGPSNSSNTIVSFLYQFGITRTKFGFGGAVSMILFAACVIITLAYRHFLLARKWD